MRRGIKEIADLSDRIENCSYQEINEALDQTTNFLGICDEPFKITEDTLVSCYSSLRIVSDRYPTLPPEEKEKYRQDNLDSLAIVEFQASWYVLREFFDDTEIEKLAHQERKEKFINYLYTFSNKFRFFENRETTINMLSKAGFIDLKQYRKETTLRALS